MEKKIGIIFFHIFINIINIFAPYNQFSLTIRTKLTVAHVSYSPIEFSFNICM